MNKLKKKMVNKSTISKGRLIVVLALVLLLGFIFVNSRIQSGSINGKNEIVKQWLLPCQNSTCVRTALQNITSKSGPTMALDSLQMYIDRYPSAPFGDVHQRAHEVGRQTAQTYGVSGEAFLRCSTSFNYGCQHGFFEKALGQLGSPHTAIEQICGKFELSPNYSPKFKFYCYHGVGHGVMMSEAYDLKGALKICDGLGSSTAQTGCWQGVFMENVNGQSRGEARVGVFSDISPLDPCDSIADKYQHECYINHAGYILAFYHSSVADASKACLRATTNQQEACLESIGLAVSNEDAQKLLLKDKLSISSSTEQKSWELCQQFPSGFVRSCDLGAVDHIMQMDQLEVKRAARFCNLIYESDKQVCFERVGTALRAQTLNSRTAADQCMKLPSQGQMPCLLAAR